jgi:hypothetical protein
MPAWDKIKTGILPSLAAVAFFWAALLLIAIGSLLLGLFPEEFQNYFAKQMDTCGGFLFLTLSFLVSWGGLKFLKYRYSYQAPFPENAVGGAALGLSVMYLPLAGIIGAGQFIQDRTQGLLFLGGIILIPTAIMLVAGTLTAAFLRKDRSLMMLASSSVLAFSVVRFIMQSSQ